MDRNAMRERLVRERADLQGTVERIRERLAVPQRDSGGEIALVDQHPADAASETEARELDVARQTMFEAKIALIDEALARLERGKYGRCVVCGQPIPEEVIQNTIRRTICFADGCFDTAYTLHLTVPSIQIGTNNFPCPHSIQGHTQLFELDLWIIVRIYG